MPAKEQRERTERRLRNGRFAGVARLPPTTGLGRDLAPAGLRETERYGKKALGGADGAK